jgi:protein-lysine N-methyltransferase EEF2KMT
LLSAAGTTGRRTWEAALHLGQYLCVNQSIISGKRVLELGAGTGYLTVLCARHLGATEVISTDGSSEVVCALADNLFVNSLQESGRVRATQLKWGHTLVDNDDLNGSSGTAVDVVLGADITFDESIIMPLLGTIQEVFETAPRADCLIAATERNRKTFDFFLGACTKVGLDVKIVDFAITKIGEQMGPFYDDSVPIRICQLKARHT